MPPAPGVTKRPCDTSLLVLLALLSAPSAAAEFEGVLEMKIIPDPSTQGGWTGGTVRILVGKSGMRSEVVAQTAQKPFQLVSLVRASEPGVTYTLDEATKTYQKFDNAAAPGGGGPPPTVKRLGTEKVLGRTVEHVLLTSASKGKEEELWIDTSLVPPARFVSAFERDGGDDWWAALRSAGVLGLPLKMVFRATAPGSKATTVEATKVEPKHLPGGGLRHSARGTTRPRARWRSPRQVTPGGPSAGGRPPKPLLGVGRGGFEGVQHRLGGAVQVFPFSDEDADGTGEGALGEGPGHQRAVGDFVLDARQRQHRRAEAQLHRPLDGLHVVNLHGRLHHHALLSKHALQRLARGRLAVKGDEGRPGQRLDGDFCLGGEGVRGRAHHAQAGRRGRRGRPPRPGPRGRPPRRFPLGRG